MAGRDDLYLILDVARAASENDIKRAFRKLARRFHPDINPGDRSAEERFKVIAEAYEILSDPMKRQFYDANGFYTEGVLTETKGTAEWGFSFEGFDFSSGRAAGFGDVFGQVFSRQSGRRESERGQDVEYQVSLSFDAAIRGMDTKISVLRKSPCVGCNGNGRLTGSRDSVCTRCGGAGKTNLAKGVLQFAFSCPDCGGTGKQIMLCDRCGGDGRIQQNDLIDIQIPAGVSTGSRIRFSGKGDAGRLSGPPGDLFVVTNVAPHSFFTRVGDNIHCSVPISITEAVLGAKVEVPTIDGRAMVRIPPGTQNGQTFRLRSRGAPSLIDPAARGDQYVEVKVAIPRVGDERSKEILRELAKLNPDDPRREIWK